jgi:hypothetical protein
MGTASGMLAAARADLGLTGRPNHITREYAARHGSGFLTASWCDMSITCWARKSGNFAAVLPGGDRAYTVWHAQDFQKAGRWYSGTTANVDKARPGDIVFFDWGLSNSIGAIDHVGIVEKVLGGGRVQTIEGNTSDAVRRRVRSASVIAGYGRPAYASAPSNPDDKPDVWTENIVTKLPTLKRGASGEHVETVQGLLIARSHPVKVDGDFGPATEDGVRAVQRWGGIKDDGIVGSATWPVLLRINK